MKIVYLTTCFGTPSHTFIRREIRELRNQGVEVNLFGIRKDTNIADDAQDLVSETQYLYPLPYLTILLLNLYYMTVKANKYWPLFFESFSAKNGNLKMRLKLAYHLMVSVVHARAIHKTGASHIHAHFLNVSSSIAMFCAELTDTPYSITVHSAGERDLPHVAGIAMKLKHARDLAMISQFNIDYYSEIFPCHNHAKVIRCGMDLDSFTKRDLNRNTQSPLRILAVGRFVEKKGFEYLIRAASILKQQSISVQIEILGDGPLLAPCQSLVQSLDVADCITLSGYAQTNVVKEKMKNADAVVVPSVTSKSGEMEGIPVVIMEAMATATPVIASAHSGIPELVINNQTGVLIPERDEEALAKAIQEFCYSAETTQNACNLIEEQFNIKTVVQQRISLFS